MRCLTQSANVIYVLQHPGGGLDGIDGWYNDSMFGWVPGVRGFWGMHDTDLAWFRLPRD